MAGGSVVGLDIGSNQMKVAEMRRGGGGSIEVVALGVAPTPPEAFDNSVLVDAQALGVAVKNLLKQTGVTARQVVSSVSGQSAVVVRVIEVPKMNPAELAETMKWEVERQVPFATGVDQIIMDYQPIERPEGVADGQNMEVLLAVAQQDMIDRHVEMLFAAGLKPVAIDVEPLAAGRNLLEMDRTTGQAAGHTVAIINIGASNTDVGIFRDKLLAFPRTLALAGDNLTRAISEAFMVDMATAENYKREMGEVLLDQMAPPAPDFGMGDGGAGGFMDFSAPAPVPTATPSSPSGRMPFDFSTPGETPPSGPPAAQATPFDLTGAPLPSPYAAPSAPLDAPAPFAPVDPFGAPVQNETLNPFGGDASLADPTFSTSTPDFGSPPPSNLPVVSTGDPNRDALRIQVFNAIAPVLAELVQELRRSLDYYRSRTGDAPIHEILLAGGTARLRNLAPFLEAELGIPTRVAEPLSTVSVTSKNYSPQHLEEIASLFPISIGLGARDLIAAPAGAKGAKRR